MTHSDQDYIDYDPFLGEDGTLTLQNVTIRTARKEHICMGFNADDSHTIAAGQRYRHERARVDGDFWGEWKICLNCLDKWIDELEGEESDD